LAKQLCPPVESVILIEKLPTNLDLQVAAGLNPGNADFRADVDGDRKIGLAEAIYVLRKAAGLDKPPKGTTANGAPCSADSQCRSGFCNVQDGVCGERIRPHT